MNARWVDRMMYRLKRLYGRQVTVCLPIEGPRDVTRNVFDSGLSEWVVPKAIVFGREASRDFVYDLNYIAANKNFTMGAMFDTFDRLICIHICDLPSDFNPSLSMYITVGEHNYEVQKYIDFDPFGRVLMFPVKGVVGNRKEEAHA